MPYWVVRKRRSLQKSVILAEYILSPSVERSSRRAVALVSSMSPADSYGVAVEYCEFLDLTLL